MATKINRPTAETSDDTQRETANRSRSKAPRVGKDLEPHLSAPTTTDRLQNTGITDGTPKSSRNRMDRSDY